MQESSHTKSFTWSEPKIVSFLVWRLYLCFYDDYYTYHQLVSFVPAVLTTSEFIFLMKWFRPELIRHQQLGASWKSL